MLKKPSLLDRLKTGIQKTRAGLMEKLEDAISGRKEIDAHVLEELEYALITADIGTRTTDEILERIRQRVERHQLADSAELKASFANTCSKFCKPPNAPSRKWPNRLRSSWWWA